MKNVYALANQLCYFNFVLFKNMRKKYKQSICSF